MSSFRFKHFSIRQNKTAMKVGTDTILFGSWLKLSINQKLILDVGTGTGLLALMMAQKSANIKITGLEIDQNAYHQAVDNSSLSPWKNRIRIIHTDARIWSTYDKFDLIISNPPYFSNSLTSNYISKRHARHQQSFSLSDLVDLWKKQGSNNSELSCILPVNEAEKLIALIDENGFFMKKYTKVKPKSTSNPNRIMLLFVKENVSILKSELYIRNDDGTYSDEYIELTKDYYLGL
tara:strand:+ start:1390 stop:2094 length:705 start_codon:yes stop_codon:yes gene_type:complete